jgi:hypothetical protein
LEFYKLADAVVVEPLSTRKFPADRKKDREFCRRQLCAILKANTRANTAAHGKIPDTSEQGRFLPNRNFGGEIDFRFKAGAAT